MKDRDELVPFLEYSSNDSSDIPCGYPLQNYDEQKRENNFWKLNLEKSIHRSIGQHMVQVSEKNILPQLADIEDSEITRVDTKRGIKLKAHKHITTKPYKALQNLTKTLHCDYKKFYGSEISYDSFNNLKLFYVLQPTERETEMCLCSKFLNLHFPYNAMKVNVNIGLPYSLSEYLCKICKCSKEDETNHFHHDCILGKCEKKCSVLNISDYLHEQLQKKIPKNIHYYVFETAETKYFNKKGEQVSCNRTACIDKHDSIQNIVTQLQSLATYYLLHHFFVVNDKIYWKKFFDGTNYYTLWMGYSQNIVFK